MRKCECCGEDFPIEEFSAKGRKSKTCQTLKRRAWEKANKDYLKEQQRLKHLRYKSERPEEVRKARRDYYDKNKEKVIAAAKANSLINPRNPATYKAWAVKNKDRRAIWNKNSSHRNRAKRAAQAAARRAQKRKATPSWFVKEKVESFYESSNALGMLTGVYYHVDHIVPLVSKFVCGLHVQDNLRVIEGVENLSKGNRWWPDM